MNDLPEKLDEELKGRLFDYTEESPPGLWEKIAPVIPGSNGRTNRLAEILILILIISMIGLEVSDSTLISNKVAVSKDQKVHSSIDKESNSVNPKTSDLPDSETQHGTRPDITTIQSNALQPGSDGVQEHTQNEQVTMAESHNGRMNTPVTHNSDIQPETAFDVHDLAIPTKTAGTDKQPELKNRELISESRKLQRDKDELTYRKFNMYFTVMPTLGYQRVEANEQDNILVEGIKRLPLLSTKRLGVRAEFGAELPLSKKIKAFGGLLYYQRKQTISYVEQIIDTTYLYTDPDGNVLVESEINHLDKSYEYELNNLGVQVGLNFLLSENIFKQTIGTGVEFQIALNKLDRTIQAEGFSQPSVYVFYNFYYRLQYPATGRLKGVVQPTLNYSMYLNQKLNAPFYVKPYGLGINIGATYNF